MNELISEILAAKSDVTELNGVPVEFDPDVAELMGAFEEDAINIDVASESAMDNEE
ncbi:hypothetical protein [Pseudoalteromonas galatheae]|uniref:hypothetical protein n=1 Tax=Pseudoalteromonas galatheae TaxID=579562 RepID=UPI0030D2F362